MREPKKVKIEITQQGAPAVNFGWVHKLGKGIVAIGIDLQSKYCNLMACTNGDSDGPGVILVADKNTLYLKRGKSVEELTWIQFPEYQGWNIWCAQIGRYTLSICLIKEK